MHFAFLVTLFAAGVALAAPSNCTGSKPGRNVEMPREYERVYYIRRDSSTARDAAKVRKGMANVGPGSFVPGSDMPRN